ncbi:MAG TPA: undecaprenyl-diphosphate phosphatase [Planctomycetota bacterium]|nr:undecaprenyl-diphosphate phosphatase [Planctomycetota bacterium]
MNILEAILLGIIQGLTEFLPISSSGHLAVAERLLGRDVPLAFDVLLHFASLAAVVIVLWGDLWSLLTTRRRLILPLIIGTIPAGLAGVLLGDRLENAKHDMLVVGCCFIVTGVALAVGERLARSRTAARSLTGIGLVDALIVGLAQAVALLPGVSRSGMTISAVRMRGVSREDCVRFSFLLAVPVIAGAGVLEAPKMLKMAGGVGAVPLAAGAVAGLAASILAIKLLLKIVRRVSLGVFSYYCLPLGMLLFVINAPAPVSRVISSALSITAASARIVAYVLIAAFVAAVIRFVFFGLLRGERSARPLAPE